MMPTPDWKCWLDGSAIAAHATAFAVSGQQGNAVHDSAWYATRKGARLRHRQ
jgi:hypothetical protein